MKKPTIYVVQNDDATRDALRSLFIALDFNVATFSCAEKFLQSAYETTHACLIADVNLPGKSGMQLLEHLNQSDCSIPTIILDSSGEIETAVQAMRIGAVDFIEKPFVDRVLVKRICDLLEVHTQYPARLLKWIHFSIIAMERRLHPDLRQLRDFPELATLSPTNKEEIHFLPGEYRVREGEKANAVYFIKDGEVAIIKDGVEVDRQKSPGVVGEMGVLAIQPRTAGVECLTEVTAFRVNAQDFLETIDDCAHYM